MLLLKELFSVRDNKSTNLLSLYGTLQFVMNLLISWCSDDALYYNLYCTICIIWKCIPSLIKGLLCMEISKDEEELILSEKNSTTVKTKLSQWRRQARAQGGATGATTGEPRHTAACEAWRDMLRSLVCLNRKPVLSLKQGQSTVRIALLKDYNDKMHARCTLKGLDWK